MTLVVERLSAPSRDAAALIAELDAVLGGLYPPEQRHGLSLDQAFAPHVRFFLARLEGRAVGCGAVALFDGYGEVKRMYTRPGARGRGVAGAILARLEQEARMAGREVLRLETGISQPEAIALYKGRGFRPRAAFGHYASLPFDHVCDSVFFEKVL